MKAIRPVVRSENGLWAFERVLQRNGFPHVAGADEAGRGACAGPLVVAAVVLPDGRRGEVPGLADSKLLSAAARERAYDEVVSSEAIGRVQPGAALIALAEGAPIVPVVIQGTIYIKKSLRHPVTVMFGPPLQVSETAQRGRAYRDAVVSVTADLQGELERLQRRTQAAIAAGRPRDLTAVDAGLIP